MSGEGKQGFLFEEHKTLEGVPVGVALETGADEIFTYLFEESLGTVQEGVRVEVPFGRGDKRKIGFVVSIGMPAKPKRDGKDIRYKAVKKVLDDEPLLGKELLELARWISDYYVCPLGQVLGAMLPGAVKKGIGKKKVSCACLASGDYEPKSKAQEKVLNFLQQSHADREEKAVPKSEILEKAQVSAGVLKTLTRGGAILWTSRYEFEAPKVIEEDLRIEEHPITLTDEQKAALDAIGRKIETGSFSVTLLHGVTSSGKTEVYLRAIERVLSQGKGAIVLVPEIALSAQMTERFLRRFSEVAVLHSGLTDSQRNRQWHRIREGQARVVIGPRSAVFAPVENLGLIVVDEEHEGTYKQDTVPRYHGRDTAVKRGQIEGAAVILGSATPSLESLWNCQRLGHFERIRLTRRVMQVPMPEMQLVDMNDYVYDGGVRLFSDAMTEAIGQTLSRGEQAILLLNRRGYSYVVRCGGCGYLVECSHCSASMTFHRREGSHVRSDHFPGRAICHHCLSQTVVPRKCPLCGKPMGLVGMGSQKLEEVLVEDFPGAKVERFDTDSMAGRDYFELLGAFGRGEIDILCGTQMLAKGLHFPNVTLVGIVNADTALGVADFRANERTFQLIHQVSGRAGRAQKPGRVIVQTLFPDHEAVQFAIRGDFDGFAGREIELRKSLGLPPFTRLAIVLMRDENYERLSQAAQAMRGRLETVAKNEGLSVSFRGPVDAAISRMARQHRVQIIATASKAEVLNRLFRGLRRLPAIRPAVTTVVDMDPVHVM